MHFYWQLLKILFADDRAKKNMQLQLLVFQERKNIFLARQFWRGSAERSWLSYPTLLISFSPIWLNASRGCDDIIARNEKKVKV